MQENLLRTKLIIPPVRPSRVLRPQLSARLDHAAAAQVTLVSAPAGYGKTSVVAGWIAEAAAPPARRVAWLTLDDSDNDPVRFIAHLVAALQELDAQVGTATQGMLAQGAQMPAPALLGPLLNDLSNQTASLSFILDDYHAIEERAVHEAVAYFIEHQPPQLHLILISREDPPLPLSRWRGRGRLVEFRRDELRFTRREIASFLHDVMALDLDPGQVTALAERTEGWIAGLQLAALAMQGAADVDAFVRSFAGSSRYILDYLIDEVFRQQPDHVQTFLLVTSLLDRLRAPLCAAVLAAAGAQPTATAQEVQALLEQLERTNLFVVPLDDQRRWFRYHHLFAELLRHQLRRRGWETAPLHDAAGRWHAAYGSPDAAVEHFLQAENWEEAAALLDGYGETMLKRGEASTFLRWMGMIPEDVIYRWQELCLSYVWASIFAGQLETVDHLLQTPHLAASPDPAVAGSVLAARAYVARLRQDVPQTIALSRRALETMTDADPNLRAVLAVGLGLAYWQTGQVQESVTALVEAIEMGRRAENHYATLVAIGFLATARATQGQLREAIGLLEEAFRWWRDLPASSGSYHIMGALLYEQNDLKGAATHIEQGIALARRSGNVELLEGACRQMARLQQALGDTVAARGALEEATRAAGDGATPLSRSRIAAAHAQLALDHGDLEAARHWAAQREVAVDPSPFYPLLDLLPARLSLAAGDKDAAARHLQEQAARALAAGWQYGLIETRLLQALAASDVERALTFLEDALQRGAPEGFVRVFVDHGAALLSLLHAAAQRNIHAPYVRKLVAAFGSAPGPVPMPAPAEAAPATALVEPLSERELEIVALLLARRTNAEIALALSISVNTVKTHLRHIYEKLGVNDRHAAARRARELNLVPPRA